MAKKTRIEIREFEQLMKKRKTFFVLFLILLYVAIAVVTLFFVPMTQDFDGWTMYWWLTITGLVMLYTALSIHQVDEDELGTIIFLGMPVWSVRSGPVLVPLFLCELRLDPKGQIQLEMGTPTAMPVSSGSPTPTAPAGTVVANPTGMVFIKKDDNGNALYRDNEPFRVTFDTPSAKGFKLTGETEADYNKKDALIARVTGDPQLVFTWRIENHARFIEEIGTVVAANELIHRGGASATQETLGKMIPAQALRHLDFVNQQITKRIEVIVGEVDSDTVKDKSGVKKNANGKVEERYPWIGINFLSALVKNYGLPRTVNQALATARGTEAAAEATRFASEAERDKLKNEGEGRAGARFAEGTAEAEVREKLLKAEAAGIEAMAKASTTEAGQLAQYLQVLKEALSKSNANVFLGDSVTSAIAGITRIISTQQGGQPLPPPP